MSDSNEETWLSALQALHLRQGAPSTRKLAGVAGYSHSTVADTLAGRRFPSLSVLLAIVEALGGDREQFTEPWLRAKQQAFQAAMSTRVTRSSQQIMVEILEELREIRALLEKVLVVDRMTK